LVVAQHWDASGSGEEKARVWLEIPTRCRRDGDGHELETWNWVERSGGTASGGRCAWLRAARAADADLSGSGGERGGEGDEDGGGGEHVGWL